MRTDEKRTSSTVARIGEGVKAGSVAAVIGGIPSTLYSLAAGRDPLEATTAAGSLLLQNENRRGYLISAAIPVHFGLSAFWGVVLALFLPRRWPVVTGTLAGVAIGVFDLLVVGRRCPRIRALPRAPQFADHVAFGITVTRLLQRTKAIPVRDLRD